jgi:hypothetical protein
VSFLDDCRTQPDPGVALAAPGGVIKSWQQVSRTPRHRVLFLSPTIQVFAFLGPNGI